MGAMRGYWQRFGQQPLLRRRILSAAGLGGAGLVAAAILSCGREERPAVAPATKEPQRGGTIAFNFPIGETPHQDPHLTATLGLHEKGMGMAYSRLFRWKLEEAVYPREVIIEGDLVEKWEQPDPQTLIVQLVRGVKWHAIPPVNGRELVSQDVIYSFNRQLAEKVNAGFLEPVARMTAVDGHTLRVDLPRPEADLLMMLASLQNVVVAREAVELRGDLREGPTIGTGPWVFQEWQRSQLVRMVRNPDYFRRGLPYADTLTLFRITDPQTQQAAFRTKQILAIDRANRQEQELLRRDVPNLQVVEAKLIGVTGAMKLWLHAEKAPTSDIRVRQAVSKAIDREAFIRSVMFGSAWINAGVFMPSLDWHLPEAELKRLLGQNLTEARQLLAAAGVTSWSPTMKNMNTPPDSVQSGELLAAQLRGLNISPTISLIDNVRTLEEVWNRGEFEIHVSTQQPLSGGPSVALRRFYKTGGAQNGGKLSDAQLDEWIEKQAIMVGDREGRKRVLQDIQRRVIELAVIVPIYSYNEEAVIWPTVKGYFNTRGVDHSVWERVWLEA